MPLPDAVLKQQLERCLIETNLPLDLIARGKVRDVYALDAERLLLVTTDRVSAFDHVLHEPIPFKGQVLNQLAALFLSATGDLVPNHVLAIPDPSATVARRCQPLPVEFVVRGYLAGHAWRVYDSGRRFLCGVPLPDGLRHGERLPAPVLTPTTKATAGHDEDIEPDEVVKRGIVGSDTFEEAAHHAMQLFARGTKMANQRGLILVDTKYEFGIAPDGQLLLIDEVHTPDSSRYYYAEGYDARLEAGEPQQQLSKEFLREWLIEQGFSGQPGQTMPRLPDDLRVEVASRYVELFEMLTGKPFEPDTHPQPAERIEENVAALA